MPNNIDKRSVAYNGVLLSLRKKIKSYHLAKCAELEDVTRNIINYRKSGLSFSFSFMQIKIQKRK